MLLGFYSKGLLPPLLRPWAQSRRPPARWGGSFLCVFRVFLLVRVPMGLGPFLQHVAFVWLKPYFGQQFEALRVCVLWVEPKTFGTAPTGAGIYFEISTTY